MPTPLSPFIQTLELAGMRWRRLEADPEVLSVALGSGVEATATALSGPPPTLVQVRTPLGTGCRTEPARLRAVLERQSYCIGAKLAVDDNAVAWAVTEIAADAVADDVRFAFFSIVNTVNGWTQEVIGHLDGEAPDDDDDEDRSREPHVAFNWDPGTIGGVGGDTLATAVARVLDDVAPGHTLTDRRFALPDGVGGSGTTVYADHEGEKLTVSSIAATVADPYAAGLGALLRRNGELPLVRIALDEIDSTVTVERELLGATFTPTGLIEAIGLTRAAAASIKDEVEVLGAPLAQYRTGNVADRIALLRAFVGVTQEWAWRTEGRVSAVAAATLDAVEAELAYLTRGA